MKKWLKKALFSLCCAVVGVSIIGTTACSKKKEAQKEPEQTTCEHVWDDGTVTKEATCDKEGEKTYKCKECGETKTESIEAAHKYEDSVCVSLGYTKRVCELCGASTKVEGVGDASECTYTKTTTETATCTTDGMDVYTCSECGNSYRNVTSRASGHNTKNATWTSSDSKIDGCTYKHTETAKCVDCGETVLHEEEYTKHDYKVSISQYATCSEEGEKYYQCAGCGESYTTPYTDANAHVWGTPSINGNIATYTCAHNSAHTKTAFSAKSSVAATVPAADLQKAGEVELQNAAIKMDESVLQQLAGKDVDVSVDTVDESKMQDVTANMSDADKEKLGNSPVYDFTMSESGNAITSFNGKLTVTLPYNLSEGEDPDNVAIWYIDDAGKTTSMPATYTYNASEGQGYVVFETNHFSLYTVIRLTLEERCAFYGHDYEDSTVAPTCGKEGYDRSECTRCHDVKRSNFTDALQHNYESKKIEATCTSRGYTIYTCTACGDTYNSDSVAMTAHKYSSTVKAPTCTAEGYTVYTCSDCGKSYTDSIVSAKGHSYSNGACVGCGRKDPNTTGSNFYLNLVESLATADSYMVEIKDYVVTEEYIREGNDEADTFTITIDSARMVVSSGEDGFVGKGEATVVVAEDEDGEVYNTTVNAKIVLRDGMMYMYATGTEDGDEMDQIVQMPQSAMWEEMDMPQESVLAVYQEALDILSQMSAVTNSPVNSAMQNVAEYIFDKKSSGNGYQFTLNMSRAEEMYDVIKEDSVAEVFDSLFGAGKFDELADYAVDALDMTISELETDVRDEMAKSGLSLDQLYDLVNQQAGGDEDIREYIAEMADAKLIDVLNAMQEGEEGEEMISADYAEMITSYAEQMKSVTVMEMMYGGEIPEGETEEVYDGLMAMLDMLADSSFSFKTDKNGSLVSVDIVMKNIVTENSYEYASEKVTVNGSYSIVLGGDYAGEYEDVIKQAAKVQKAVDAYDLESVLTSRNYIEVAGYYVRPNNAYAFTEIGEEIRNGQTCMKARAALYDVLRISEGGAYAMAQSDCQDWMSVEIMLLTARDVEAYVWVNADGEWVDMEVSNGYFYASGWGDFFYNVATGEISEGNLFPDVDYYYSYSMHTYVLTKTTPPAELCGYEKLTYTCSTCGYQKTVTGEGGHDYKYKCELMEGSNTCEDGIIKTRYCTTCGYVDYTYEEYYHATYNKDEITLTTKCGEITLQIYGCACGMEERLDWYREDDNCIFDYVGTERVEDDKDSHQIETYRCSICGYTYTEEEWYEYAQRDGECYRDDYTVYRFGVEDGNCDYEYVTKYSDVRHPYTWQDSEYDENDGLIHEWAICDLCGETVRDRRYDSYGRTVYYFNISNGNYTKYSRVYGENCTYTETNYNKDGSVSYTSEGVDHGTEYSAGSTSDYSYDKDTCEICGQVARERRYDAYGRTIYYYQNGYYEYSDFEHYERVYDENCHYIGTYYYEDGTVEYSYEGVEHAWTTMDVEYETCTQYTVYYDVCDACGTHEEHYRSPEYWGHYYDKWGYYDGAHNWYYDSESGLYCCYNCGTQSYYGADGLITLEDMATETEIKVGYFNKREWAMDSEVDIQIIVNYTEEGAGVELSGDDLFEQVDTTPEGAYRDSGIVTVNMENVATAIKDAGVEATTISVVFYVMQNGTWVAHALTFDYVA